MTQIPIFPWSVLLTPGSTGSKYWMSRNKDIGNQNATCWSKKIALAISHDSIIYNRCHSLVIRFSFSTRLLERTKGFLFCLSDGSRWIENSIHRTMGFFEDKRKVDPPSHQSPRHDRASQPRRVVKKLFIYLASYH